MSTTPTARLPAHVGYSTLNRKPGWISRSRLLVATIALTSLTATAHAALSVESPFLPPRTSEKSRVTSQPNLELRGIRTLGAETMFSIFDLSEKKSLGWVQLGEPTRGLSIKEYRANRDAVTIEYQGQSMDLTMRQSKVAVAAPSDPRLRVPAVARPLRPVLQPNVPPNTISNFPNTRLKGLLDDIERRRKTRSESLTPTSTAPATKPISPTSSSPESRNSK